MLACLAVKNAQFCGPVGQRQAEHREIGMPGEDFRLDSRDFAVAAFHSCRCSCTLQRYLIEGPAVTVESCLLAGEVLPSRHSHIDVGRLKFNGKGDSRFFLAGNDRRSRTGEGLIDCLPGARVVDNRTPHAFDGLLRAVDSLRVLIAVLDVPECALLSITIPVPRTAHRIPAGLMLPMVMSAAHHE